LNIASGGSDVNKDLWTQGQGKGLDTQGQRLGAKVKQGLGAQGQGLGARGHDPHQA